MLAYFYLGKLPGYLDITLNNALHILSTEWKQVLCIEEPVYETGRLSRMFVVLCTNKIECVSVYM
jgi:hypothetical protein